MTSRHWAESILFSDLRWSEHGNGPRDYNCWNFVRHIQAQHYGRELPMLALRTADDVRRAIGDWRQRREWHRSRTPADGDVLVMRGMDLHVGVWVDVDGGGVLHCQRERDVTFDDSSRLQLAGYQILRVWTWRGK